MLLKSQRWYTKSIVSLLLFYFSLFDNENSGNMVKQNNKVG